MGSFCSFGAVMLFFPDICIKTGYEDTFSPIDDPVHNSLFL